MKRRLFLAALALPALAAPAIGTAQNAPSPENLLSPEMAFRMHYLQVAKGYLSIVFRIAPGYRLYRDKITVTTPTPTRLIYNVVKPPGTMHYDAALGKTVETYDRETRVDVIMTESRPIDLVVTIQGCAEAGVCFPPLERRIHLSRQYDPVLGY
ncbi:protein-disulfide reductase DsbD domain-containing protein [Burkholderia stagnalis]|uniref:protein-disulfide reductase DsbD domain-containing protein n=1 Tax=Burkholderia stagnalis TaxID=1503054 RepID=UPI0009BFE3F7|nr:protein-disulfide reductase DsbD domain-containing protein [Burkholderia stagnalis]MDY7806090.1 protein-disulfide reductase DsbD family protein [Burkholderia stagnalis]